MVLDLVSNLAPDMVPYILEIGSIANNPVAFAFHLICLEICGFLRRHPEGCVEDFEVLVVLQDL